MAKKVSEEFSGLPEDEQGVFSIGAVAGMYGIHQQSLRQYEKLGLLVPARTAGKTRMYSKRDIERLEIILNLTQEMGVNLAGVEIILNMRAQITKLQGQITELLVRFRDHLEQEYEERLADAHDETGIVPISKSRGIAKTE